MKLIVFMCLSWSLVEIQGTEKRQVHHTHTTSHEHTSAPTDPLQAWMTRASTSKPNVLFLIVDDLRPKLGCYGETNMFTPNIDFLASKSIRFDQAFVQVSICSPSRTSFLTGRRPETTKVLDLHTYFREASGNFTTLPQYFKNHGYFTHGVGKVFHKGAASGNTDDFPYSWSQETYSGDQPIDHHTRSQAAVQPVDESVTGKLIDTTVADYAVNFLNEHSQNRDQPFFLAVGFRKPHLPWIFPQEYLSLYPHSNIDLAPHRTRPAGLPDIAWSPSGEIRRYHDILALNTTDPDNIIPDDYQVTMRQAYSAATSFMDSQLGRVMEALSRNGFAENTIVTFLGDHGWHLGDNAEWAKQTNFDMALRVPMMLYIPGVTSNGHRFRHINPLASNFNKSAHPQQLGRRHSTSEIVEAIDLYPTITELAGLHVPHTCGHDSRHEMTCLEGTSLVPLVRQVRGLPNGHSFTWKDAAFSMFHRRWSSRHPIVGFTVRTKTHRYTEWVGFDRDTFEGDFSDVHARELYSHDTDPHEINNLADDPHSSNLISKLSHKLHAGWRQTLQDYLNSIH